MDNSICMLNHNYSNNKGVKRSETEEPYFKNVFSDNDDADVNISDSLWIKNARFLIKYVDSHILSFSSIDLYTGLTGHAYIYYYVSTSDVINFDSEHALNKATKVLIFGIDEPDNKQSLCQFICGKAGWYAVMAAVYNRHGDLKNAEKYLECFKSGLAICKPIDFFKPGGDELCFGRAGYLFGIIWLEKDYGRKIIPDKDIIELCSTIVESGRSYSKKNKSMFPLMYSYDNKEYLGAAHGLSSILQVLISFPQFIEKDQQAMQDIKKSIDILMSLQTASGNFPCVMEELGSTQRLEKDELVQWCHGAPGIVYLFAKAYLVFKEHSYLECCLKCGDLVWMKGLLKKGPGLCHGIAGNGYVFLLLYRLTGDKKHLNRAIKFGEFLCSDSCVPILKKPYSLFEGLLGTACYLNDLMQPEKASFPFLDVF